MFAGSLNVIIWIGYIIVTSLYARAFAEYSMALLSIGENSVRLYIFGSVILVIFVFFSVSRCSNQASPAVYYWQSY